jgi:hypothetical protein
LGECALRSTLTQTVKKHRILAHFWHSESTCSANELERPFTSIRGFGGTIISASSRQGAFGLIAPNFVAPGGIFA